VRVRSLSNPKWHRDPQWLARMLDAQRTHCSAARRNVIDKAIEHLREYQMLKRRGVESVDEFATRCEERWDNVLMALDAYLELTQHDHLRAVKVAGASGPTVPEV
jgi:hypothetical protein